MYSTHPPENAGLAVKNSKRDVVEHYHLAVIPPGTFLMGTRSDEGYKQEQPAHEVSLDGFYMGKYCVTVKEFYAFIQDLGDRYDEAWSDYMNPCFIYKKGDSYEIWPGAEDYPMVIVNVEGAAAYCNWCSEKSGLEKVYDEETLAADLTRNGFRLPTEAEWEYACAGPDGHMYAGGHTYTADLVNDRHYAGEASDLRAAARRIGGFGMTDYSPLPVGKLPPNGFGLHDMLGNIYEWCLDRYGPYAEGRQENPVGQVDNSFQVIRGGCFMDDRNKVRRSFRHAIHYQAKCFIQGFRLAKNTYFNQSV